MNYEMKLEDIEVNLNDSVSVGVHVLKVLSRATKTIEGTLSACKDMLGNLFHS